MTDQTAHQAAVEALALGYAVVPPRQDGTKAPDGQWRTYIERLPTPAEVDAWWGSGARTGLGVVCGAVSGNLEMLEFEGRAVADGMLDLFNQAATAVGLGDLVHRVVGGFLESTPSGGRHLLYRVTGPIAGNTKLARRVTPDGDIEVLLETRGEGGYVVVAPSHGTVHPSGLPWTLMRGGFGTVATITPAERDALHQLARTFDAMPAPAIHTISGTERSTSNGDRPGDWWNAQPDIQAVTLELLERHGWQAVHQHGDTIYLRRPGKTIGVSATLGHIAPGVLRVFTTSTTFEDRAHDAFGVYARLEHGGDIAAAARAARAVMPKDEPVRHTPIDLSSLPPQAAQERPTVDPDDADPSVDIGASWRRTALAAIVEGITTGTIVQPTPTVGRYTSGAEGALWYTGRVNGLYGEPGKGKTMVAVAVAAQVLNSGGAVVWIDLEEPAPGIVQRLLDLGATPTAIVARFAHYAPEETIRNALGLLVELEALEPVFVVIDSTGEALALEGWKPNDDDEVANWFRTWPRRIANHTGAAVLVIDHVTKDENTRGLWPGGSQRKKAAITGSAFMVNTLNELGRGVEGRLKLTTSKDRLGWHRSATKAAEFVLDATGDTLIWELVGETVATAGNPFRPTGYMERVSQWMVDNPEPASQNEIVKGVGGRADTVRKAITALVVEGYIEQSEDGKQRHLHTLNLPFVDAVELGGEAA